MTHVTPSGCPCQEAPSAKRCIKTDAFIVENRLVYTCQEAPSAKRWIKTVKTFHAANENGSVRKHRAPKGALRPGEAGCVGGDLSARKHRAPKGALRQGSPLRRNGRLQVRKHRAPYGALRPIDRSVSVRKTIQLESTERQKVH